MSVIDSIRSALGHKDNGDGALGGPGQEGFSWLVFSDEDMQAERAKMTKKAALLVMAQLALGIIVFSAVWALSAGESPSLGELLRRGEEPHDAQLVLEMDYNGLKLEKDITVDGVNELYRQIREFLPGILLG